MIRIFTQGATNPVLKDWKWCKRNLNKIAYNYDAEIEKFDSRSATLRDGYGRLMFVDAVSKRFYSKHYKKVFTK